MPRHRFDRQGSGGHQHAHRQRQVERRAALAHRAGEKCCDRNTVCESDRVRANLTHQDREDSASLAIQRADFETWCRNRGITHDGWYEDENVSEPVDPAGLDAALSVRRTHARGS